MCEVLLKTLILMHTVLFFPPLSLSLVVITMDNIKLKGKDRREERGNKNQSAPQFFIYSKTKILSEN